MKKQKKITVKHYLNLKLEPLETSITEDDRKSTEELLYPLYYMVIYNRNNTKFKSRIGFYYAKIEDVPLDIIDFESKTIEKILRYQISKKGEDMNLKGLGDTFQILSEGLMRNIEGYLKNKLRLATMRTDGGYLASMINFDDWRNPFSKYYEAISTLAPNLSKFIKDDFKNEIEAYHLYSKLHLKLSKEKTGLELPSLIDWLNGSFKDYIQDNIKSKKEAESIIALIDSSVKRPLNQID